MESSYYFFTRHPQASLIPSWVRNFVTTIKGYQQVCKDTSYISFILGISLGMIAPLLMWNLQAVYSKINYNLHEAQYAWIPVANALMCVFVQYFVTKYTRKHHQGMMIALGMLVYALGVGSVVLMSNIIGFLVSMIILTFGELILISTATAFAAARAPDEYRGRYMSLYWLTWGFVRAIAPIIGVVINDAIAARAICVGGFVLVLPAHSFILSTIGNHRSED